MAEQDFENHTKFVPLFHVYVLGVLALNFLWSLYHWKMLGFSLDGLVSILLASALVLLAFFARIFALTVQDRVIRLEERLRYERVLPGDLRPRVGELSLSQIVSMRFASDAELPALARKVLDEKLCDRKVIKQLIKNWKPDYLRA